MGHGRKVAQGGPVSVALAHEPPLRLGRGGVMTDANVSALQAVEFVAVTVLAARSTRRVVGERVAAMVVIFSCQTGKE